MNELTAYKKQIGNAIRSHYQLIMVINVSERKGLIADCYRESLKIIDSLNGEALLRRMLINSGNDI